MVRNILALQQNLSNFVPLAQCSMMERAREYYQLFNLGSEVSLFLIILITFFLLLLIFYNVGYY